MARQLDQIIVIDVESTCWDGGPPPGQENEIIEIGVCSVDVATGERLARHDILFRPETSRVSAFCTQLTTLTQQQADSGVTFEEACTTLKSRYLTKERLWASYGDYDRRQFERQCLARDVSYPFGPSHLNVKTLFALVHGLPREVGMDAALEQLSLPLEGTHHRAGDDAWNIALILARLVGRTQSATERTL